MSVLTHTKYIATKPAMTKNVHARAMCIYRGKREPAATSNYNAVLIDFDHKCTKITALFLLIQPVSNHKVSEIGAGFETSLARDTV
jgi:hypothetical protein